MKTKDILAFIGLSLGWGSSFFWVKVALQELGPFTLVALRLLFGALGLALIAILAKATRPQSRAQWAALLLLGITNVAFPFVLTTWGQIFIDSGVASILLSTVPLLTVVIAHFALREDRLTVARAVGLVAGFGGVVILLLRGSSIGAGISFWGYASQLVGSLFYAASGVFAHRKLRGVSIILQALIPIAFADAILWSLVPIVESPIRLPNTSLVTGAILFLGVVCSCLAYLFYYYLLHSIGPTRTAMVTYVFPLVSVTLGTLLLKEAIDSRLVLGAALILGSVFVVNRA